MCRAFDLPKHGDRLDLICRLRATRDFTIIRVNTRRKFGDLRRHLDYIEEILHPTNHNPSPPLISGGVLQQFTPPA